MVRNGCGTLRKSDGFGRALTPVGVRWQGIASRPDLDDYRIAVLIGSPPILQFFSATLRGFGFTPVD